MNKQAQLLALGTLFVFFALHQQARAQSNDAPRYEIGAQFSTLTMNIPEGTTPGFGGRFTFNFTDYVAAEAQVDFYPTDKVEGGRTTSALFGVKAGKRFKRFGLYAKARPGFVHFSRTFAGFIVDPNPAPAPALSFAQVFRGRTEFAMDIGTVLEFYPTRRIVTRFDVGDTIIRFGERTTNIPVLSGTTVNLVPFTQPSQTRHNFQFSVGIGFRF